MLFYRTMPDQRLQMSTTRGARNIAESTTATMRGVWMVKCFMTGVALLGLAYWLVQIAGAQYLATLTSATLLSFLLVYIVWCLTVKRRHQPQNTDSVGVAEPPVQATSSGHVPPSSLALNPALKHYGVPPRDCSPPPTYEEVLRQMAAAASTSGVAVPSNDTEAPPPPPSPPPEATEIQTPTSTSTPIHVESHDQVTITNEAREAQPTPPPTPTPVHDDVSETVSSSTTEPVA